MTNQVPRILQDTLIEFTMTALLHQPENIMSYAEEYLNDFKSLRRIPIVYDYDIPTSKASSEHSEPEMPEPRNTRRIAVCGESYDPMKVTEEFVKPIHEKTEEEMNTLRNVAMRTILFKTLDEEQLEDILNAVFKKLVQPGEIIIEQGEDGDNFYVIEKGTFNVFQAQPGEERQYIHSYENSGFFGELALLYNQPRAATVIAVTSGVIWALDRKTFRHIVVQGAIEKRTRYEDFIETVPILEYLTPYEKNLLVDAFIPRKFKDGDEIYKKSDESDGIYFVEEGEVKLKVKDLMGNEFEVDKAVVGDFFGEDSVLAQRPRRETAVAAGDVKLAFLDTDGVHNILAPCMAALKEKAASREKCFKETSRSSMLAAQSSTGTPSEDEVPVRSQRPARRIAVSGESYDPMAALQQSFIKPVYEKSPEEMDTLRQVAENTLLFRTLDEEQLTDILNAVFKRNVKTGDVIIKQGDDGDNFYVIEKGLFDVYMRQPGKKEELIHTYEDSGFFGELALLYNQPRAATVIATTDGIIWALDRNTFRRIVVQAAFEKRTRFEDLIENIPLLKGLGSYEKSTLVDALAPKHFLEGEIIYEEFNNVDGMYFVEKGSVVIKVKNSSGTQSVLRKVGANEYFGHADILMNRPRMETVCVEEDCKSAFLDVEQFLTLLESCKKTLKKEVAAYEEERIKISEGL